MWNRLLDESSKLVEANWTSITKVAEALMKHRILTGDEIDIIMDGGRVNIGRKRGKAFVEQLKAELEKMNA